MALRYEELGRLNRGHVGGVSAVAFSYLGNYIVTAGVGDCMAYVWRAADQKLLSTVKSSSAVLAIDWLPQREDAFVTGTQGGIISTVFIGPNLRTAGFWAHKYPIEHLTCRASYLASGAKAEVVIWRRQNAIWQHVTDLRSPPSSSLNEDSELLVTSVHWTKSDRHPSLLLVSYMFHGVSLFDTADWSVVRNIPLPGAIARSSISPDGSIIAISNMVSGFDLYSLTSQAPVKSFTQPVEELRAVPVIFVHGGHALLGGSTTGTVHLWNVHNGRVHQKFSLGHRNSVMAISANYNPAADRFLIAAGITNGPTDSAPVVIWVARNIGRRHKVSATCHFVQIVPLLLVVVSAVSAWLWYGGLQDYGRSNGDGRGPIQ
ncbi:hypothetical protein BN946_scf184962.g88 [Trametes cinnabarina]|uniref:Anaphase-promoting complex subunit 4 WD40 domain-containing protein n=1 Tax=Pycnoporus cinnabarinus TaxID=5643 RepID=A0A060SCQ8_PYCCI|nr:hypothetical protein BN946_scf184962.g88 [Trametes cinnabarina]